MKRILLGICGSISMVAGGADAPLGAAPPAPDVPKIEFAFEERVTIDPAVVLGNTTFGHRQYIPITGGTVAGPMLKGQVVPGGWDFQLTHPVNNCTELSADYFLKAEDGTVIHVLNQGMACPGSPRAVFPPQDRGPEGGLWLDDPIHFRGHSRARGADGYSAEGRSGAYPLLPGQVIG